ncbi:MAG TPA: GGDEF domain-containing protein [Gemmatimonadales bacterium]|nr:GGDEF domain-containing protein [Gemmatimonadales bacterium]
MDHSLAASTLGGLPSAFAAAIRLSRTDAELFERCREALVGRFNSPAIWFEISTPDSGPAQVGPTPADPAAVVVARIRSGETEVVISTGPQLAEALRPVALPLAHGLSVVVEMRSVLMERQAALDDATFQLRALRQVARLLSSVHSSAETEQLILDFMAEVFFTWWACLLRPTGDTYEPRIFRSLDDRIRPGPVTRALLDAALPAGAGATGGQDIAVAALAPLTTQLVIPLDAGAERLAVLLLGPRLNEAAYGPAELELAATLSFAAAIALKNAHLVEQLQTAANTDELTALLNRRALEERLGAELARSTRHELDTTIILLDLDNFKLVNDSGGHAAGDELLRGVGRLLKEQCRQPDVVGRLGGDEFLVILPMTSPREAMVLVGRVQARLADLEKLGQGHPVAVSIGVAAAPRHGTTVSSLMAAADAAMYKAKRAGGNRAEVAGEF